MSGWLSFHEARAKWAEQIRENGEPAHAAALPGHRVRLTWTRWDREPAELRWVIWESHPEKPGCSRIAGQGFRLLDGLLGADEADPHGVPVEDARTLARGEVALSLSRDEEVWLVMPLARGRWRVEPTGGGKRFELPEDDLVPVGTLKGAAT